MSMLASVSIFHFFMYIGVSGLDPNEVLVENNKEQSLRCVGEITCAAPNFHSADRRPALVAPSCSAIHPQLNARRASQLAGHPRPPDS